MKASFQLIALPHEQFESLLDKSDSDLRSINARGIVVDAAPGFPCRLSLADDAVGETVLFKIGFESITPDQAQEWLSVLTGPTFAGCGTGKF